MAVHLHYRPAMVRTLLIASITFISLLCFAPSAEACGETGCQALLAMIQVDSADQGPPSLAEEGDEASVRERDRSKREPIAPEFWSQFRSYAYKQLPTHREESFTAVWVAMPLSTSEGTVPTLGVRGSWW